MTINDRIIATIRTGVPALWGMFWAWLIAQIPAVADVLAWLSEWAGEDVYRLIELALTGLVIAGYYFVARWAGERWPWLERWLVGRSLVPVYVTRDPS